MFGNILITDNTVTVKYYSDFLDEGKAKKVKDYKRDDLLPLVILSEARVTYESDNEDDNSSEEDSSDRSSDRKSESDSGSDIDITT